MQHGGTFESMVRTSSSESMVATSEGMVTGICDHGMTLGEHGTKERAWYESLIAY